MPVLSPAAVASLYERSKAAGWGLSRDKFTEAVRTSVAHAFPGAAPAGAEITRYLDSLHAEDLALAAACRAGLEPAWNHFVAEYRSILRRAGDALDRTGGGQELADSILAELFGLEERDGVRRSLFRYFHGRSRLATWLRAVLAQRHIDRIRSTKRLNPLPDDPSTLPSTAPSIETVENERFREAMQRACAQAIADLAPRDRMRLSFYYARGMTLAAIGKALKEHEATVSRHLTRTRAAIRDFVDARLRADHGLDDRGIAECFRAVIDDAGSMDLSALLAAKPGRKDSRLDRSKD